MAISWNKLDESTVQSIEEDSTQQQRPSSFTNVSETTAPMLVYRRKKVSEPPTSTSVSETTAPMLVYRRKKVSEPPTSTSVSKITAPMHVYKRREPPTPSTSSNVSEITVPTRFYRRRKLYQPSTSTNVSDIAAPMRFYKRRKLCRLLTITNVSENTAPMHVYKRRKLSRPSTMLVYNRRKWRRGKNSSLSVLSHSVNDSCSCSPTRSNMELNSGCIRKEVEDDTAECSSSSASERDMCISVLVRHGVIKEVWPCRASVSGIRIGGAGCKRCRVCFRSDSTNSMLLCDDCDAAFHLSCISPRIGGVPVDDWFCHSCLKKKSPQEWKEASECANTINGVSGSLRSVSASGLRPIDLMLNDDKPYASCARVGKMFQAEVPEWSGPVL